MAHSKKGQQVHSCARCHNHMTAKNTVTHIKKTGVVQVFCYKCAKSKGYVGR